MKYLSLLLFLLLGCKPDVSSTSEGSMNQEEQARQKKQLNITILLDLSDRINPKLNPDQPEHYKRDLAIVKHFAELFVDDMKERGTFMAKGKMKLRFYPQPKDPNINIYAEKLSVDLAKMNPKEKKDVHENLERTFSENASKIYDLTLAEGKWLGSDIWRFFKNDAKDHCIERDSNYRNILVILSDGYIFHPDSKDQVGNRFAYLLPENISKFHLRNNPKWEDEIKKQDFGLIVKQRGLENLEVLFLEVNPSPAHKNDEDIIEAVLGKWFNEMNVERVAIHNSDLPKFTIEKIDAFVNRF